MKTHFAWRPHLDRDALFNPFIPSERQTTMGHVELSEAYGDDTPTSEEDAATTAAEAIIDECPKPPAPR